MTVDRPQSPDSPSRPTPVILRSAAARDVDEAVDHYREQASAAVALRFIDEVEETLGHLGRHPASGSTRFAHELKIPGLRSWLLRDFPYVVFYIERQDHVDVWRVLHGSRDIPSWLQEPPG